MLNNRFFTLKKPKLGYVINKPLKQRTDLILKQIESSRRLNTD